MRSSVALSLLLVIALTSAARGQTSGFPPETETPQQRAAWLASETSRLHDEVSKYLAVPLQKRDRAVLANLKQRAGLLADLHRAVPDDPKTGASVLQDIQGKLHAAEPLSPINIPWVIAGAFVVVNALSRFNSPQTSRTDTTLGRYWTAAAAYACVNLCTWLVLILFPELLIYALERWRNVAESSQASTAFESTPFVAALVLTSLVPNVPTLSDIDQRVRVFFRDLASIPGEALRLTKILSRSPIEPDEKVRVEVSEYLETEQFVAGDIIFGESGPPAKRLWTKLRTILYWFREWEHDHRYAGFTKSFAEVFQGLQQRYAELSPVAREVFRLEAAGIKDPAAVDSIARLEKGFLVNARSLERDMCRLISRAALSCILRESARTASLVEMGFRADLTTHPLFDRLAGLAGFLAVWYSLVMVAAHPAGWAPWEMLLLGVGIAALACISIGVALWIKTFRFAQRARARRPIAGYLVAALVAMGAAFVLMWSAHLMFTRSLAVGTELQLITWPWSLVSGMIAFVASLLADDRVEDARVWRPWMQVAEAGCFAVATMVTVYAVTVLLDRKCEVVTDVMTKLFRFTFPGDCSTTFIPKPLPLQVSAAVAGGVIGWFVPAWIREAISGPSPGPSATGDRPAPGTS